VLTSLVLRLVAVGFSLSLVFAAGCGGGGGGSDAGSGGDAAAFNATFSVASANVSGVEGSAQPLHLTATINNASGSDLYLVVDYDTAVVLDVQGKVSGNSLDLTVTLRGDATVGTHASELVLHACLDEACTKEPAGSPVRLPLQYVVKPNIQVPATLALSRTGSETAPTRALTVVVPAEAGTLVMSVANSRPDAVAVTFDGNQLSVQTRQVAAGSYPAKVTLSSLSDPRYTRTIDIQYTVLAPAGGEHALSVADPARTIVVEQGRGSVQRLVVMRPTWSSDFDPPTIDDPNHIMTLVDLGNDQYDARLDSTGLAVGLSPSATIVFSAGPTGGRSVVRLTLSVTAAFYPDAAPTRLLTVTSTLADLDWTSRVLTFDGVAANWSAVSQSPWVHLQRANGRTGVDALQFTVDPAALSSTDPLIFPVQLSIDRPGIAPWTNVFSLTDNIPKLQHASPTTLVASSGRIYVNGLLTSDGGGLLFFNRLKVTGATLVGAHLVADTRMVGDVVVLAVDLTDLTPGATATISVDNPIVPTQVQVRGQAPLRAAAAYQALSFAPYRPAQFAPGSKVLYFSAPGKAFRWAFDGSGWALTQSSVAGLIDVAPAPDEATLYASDPTHTIALDPVTLIPRSIGLLQDPQLSANVFDTNAAPGARALAFSADGRAIGSLSSSGNAGSHVAGWICDKLDLSNRIETAPQPCDPGTRPSSVLDTPTGFGLLRSANGHFIAALGSKGERGIYQPETRAWVMAPNVASGLSLIAANDAGTRLVRSDGMLLGLNDVQLGSLGSAVPFTHVASGYGISSGGRFGFVYGYRLAGSGSAQTASDPTLWVIDMNLAGSAGVGAAPLIATIALPQAVGCTGALASGETCQHTASISIAPGDGTAFILGPRGVVAVPLPTAVTSAVATSAVLPGVRPNSSRPTRWTPAASSSLLR
jgi:hypothetical protein